MPFELEATELVNRKFLKISKKNRGLLEIISKKVKQILENPYHFKPLRGSMHGERRVHIDGSFVLTYEVDEQRKVVKLLDFDLHDKVYGQSG